MNKKLYMLVAIITLLVLLTAAFAPVSSVAAKQDDCPWGQQRNHDGKCDGGGGGKPGDDCKYGKGEGCKPPKCEPPNTLVNGKCTPPVVVPPTVTVKAAPEPIKWCQYVKGKVLTSPARDYKYWHDKWVAHAVDCAHTKAGDDRHFKANGMPMTPKEFDALPQPQRANPHVAIKSPDIGRGSCKNCDIIWSQSFTFIIFRVELS